MEGGKQITTDPVQPLHHPEALGITPGDLQRFKGTINRPDLRLRQGMR
jgi:hypothetical protein